jgi:hypothetical protein
MATNSVYRVTYHFEKNGKKIGDQFQDCVIAGGEDYASLSTVLTNNGRTNGGQGTLVITSVGMALAGSVVLS